MNKRPPGLVFIACTYLPQRQGKPLQATYRVPGRLAEGVERSLAHAVGMPGLKRACCQWETQRHTFHAKDGREYDITMVSDETVVGARRHWPDISIFEVVVETFTEEI